MIKHKEEHLILLNKVLKFIKENPNSNSVALQYEFNLDTRAMRRKVALLRDMGEPIKFIDGGYVWEEAGYVENINKLIIGQIKPLAISYNNKVKAYNDKYGKHYKPDYKELLKDLLGEDNE